MNKGLHTMAAAALLATLAACGSHTNTQVVISSDQGLGALHISNGQVTISRKDGPDASVGADGTLKIGDQAVVVSDAQRAQLVTYYASATGIIEHAKQTGIAGAEVGATAVKEVITGLASGDTSNIGSKVEEKSKVVTAEAGKLCGAAAALRGAQDALAAELEAFKPYAVFKDSDAECNKG